MYYILYQNKISTLYICANDTGITDVSFDKGIVHSHSINQTHDTVGQNNHITACVAWFDAYFNKDIDTHGYIAAQLPNLDIPDSPTKKMILSVPWGSLVQYGQLITPKHAQAVGQACRTNRIVIIYPCHRIVSKNSYNIYQYMGQHNHPIKQKLFKHEGIVVK